MERAARDYIEGWFDGDRARMERALHPEWAKRSLEQNASGAESVRTITAREMIEMTASGVGQRGTSTIAGSKSKSTTCRMASRAPRFGARYTLIFCSS